MRNRMQKMIVPLLVIATMGAAVHAGFWNAPIGDPNNYWDEAGKWDPVGVPDTGTKVQFSRETAECIINSAAVSGQLVVGDGGTVGWVHRLTIADGGSLVCGGTAWAASGYDRSSIVTVEQGGSLRSVMRFGVGLVAGPPDAPQISYLNIEGGDMVVHGNLQIGTVGNGTTTSNHTGIVNVKSGTLHVTGNLEFRNPSVSFIDIAYGTLTVNGNVTALVADLADNVPANISGFGGKGTVQSVYANGVTTITASHPMDPWPVWPRDKTLHDGDIQLEWTNLDPNVPGNSVWVDVWFGTDPNKLDSANYWKVISAPVAGENTTAVTVSAPVTGTVPTTYYWQVDSYIYGNPTEGVIEGDVWSFKVSDDTPPTNVSAGANMITWIGKHVDLTGTYDDDGKSPVKETWRSSNPGVVFSPSDDGGVTANSRVATATINTAGPVTLVFEADDQLNDPIADDMTVTVYENACEAARVGDNRAGDYPGDITGPDGVPDCLINLQDFAALAMEWLSDYTLPGPVSMQP